MDENSVDITQEQYLSSLEKLIIPGLEEFKIDKLLYNQSFFALTRNKPFLICTILAALFFDRETIITSNLQSELLLYSEVFNRRDHDSYWKSICALFENENKGTMTITNLSKSNWKKCLNAKRFFSKFSRFVVYFKSLSCIHSLLQRCFLSAQLLWFYEFFRKIEYYNPRPKVAMCFCDVDFHETLLVQWFKNRGILTVTNQHGQPLLRNPHIDRLNQSQVLNFNSDYFLAKGEFTREQFQKRNVPNNKVVIVGDLKHKNLSFKNLGQHNKFCVFLDTPTYPFSNHTNTKLLKFAEEISNILRMDYYVKIHPSDDIKRYQAKFDCSFLDRDINLSDCFKIIDFGLFSASAIYVDMIAFGIKSYQYCDVEFPIVESNDDVIKTVDDFISKHSKWEQKSNEEKTTYFYGIYERYYACKDASLEITKFINSLLETETS